MLRRFAPPLAALAVLACQPSVPTKSSTVDYAAFDPANGVFPQPNALVLQFADLVPGAEGEFLRALKATGCPPGVQYPQCGGFPYDQVLPVSIGLVREDLSVPTAPSRSAPPLDVKSIVPCTALTSPGSCNLLVLDALTGEEASVGASYAAGASAGTLSLTRVDTGGKPLTWRPGGQYIVALRGGPDGVKTSDGGDINPSVTMYAILFSPRAALPSDAQVLRDAYQPVFAAVENRGFPKADIAVVATFPIAPASTWVKADPTTGDMPVPSDFLFDLSTGHVTASLDSLIPGISTLDGFSTTGMVLSETSGQIRAGTIRSSAARGVYLYDLATPASPALVPDVVDFLTVGTPPVYAAVTSPPVVDPANGQTSVIGLQPAVGVGPPAQPGAPPTQISLPPLKEKNRYAVVVTTGVLDATGTPLSRTTLGTILLLSNPLCLPAGCSDPVNPAFPGVSTLLGVSAVDAAGLESQRLALQPVLAALEAPLGCASATDPVACVKGKVAFGYTFRTQTVTDVAFQLPLLPYAGGAFGIKPTDPTVFPTVAAAFATYGVDGSLVTSGNIDEVLETTIPTVNLLDPNTGAFDPNSSDWRLLYVPATVVVPTAAALAAVPNCPGTPLKCAPLAIFHHGLHRGRADMLLVADNLAAQGFVVASIDGPLHGDRSYCTRNADCVLDDNSVGTCTPVAAPGTPQAAESPPPGTCTAGTLVKETTLCLPTTTCAADFAAVLPSKRGGIAATSGFYAIHPPAAPNLYRTRDSIRQDLVDVSSLALALARPPPPILPALPSTAPSPVAVHLRTVKGIVVNPGAVYYLGQSLGALVGTLHAAAQPQVSRFVLNVGGGTIGDILTQSPAFVPPGPAPTGPLSFADLLPVHVLKWILDPAEPVNFAGIVRARRQPTPPTPLTHVDVLGQWAACDGVVPNVFSVELYDLVGLGAAGGTSSSVLYRNTAASTTACVLGVSPNPGTLDHGFLTDWGLGSGVLAISLAGQDDAAAFLLSTTALPAPVRP